jgi:hypothetical protein
MTSVGILYWQTFRSVLDKHYLSPKPKHALSTDRIMTVTAPKAAALRMPKMGSTTRPTLSMARLGVQSVKAPGEAVTRVDQSSEPTTHSLPRQSVQ